MSSTAFITQPTYLPWVGIFKAIELSDTFVFYDDVQFERHSWQNRNRLLDPARNVPAYLTVPVAKHSRETNIEGIGIADPKFAESHLSKMRAWYSRAPFASETLALLESVYAQGNTGLADLTTQLTVEIARHIGLAAEFRRSHEFDITGDKHTRPLAFAEALGATTYLTQVGTREYTNIAAFEAAGIQVMFLDFHHPTYSQQATPFTPFLSIVDMLMNIGAASTLSLIQRIELLASS